MNPRQITTIITQLSNLPNCDVYSPDGLPTLQPSHLLPNDLRTFYEKCGGMYLFTDGAFPCQIVSPRKFRPANFDAFSGVSESELVKTKNHISWFWYTVAEYSMQQVITIDLSSERLGLCYDSHWLLHPGNSYVVALSFTDLLLKILEAQGKYEFWDANTSMLS